MPLKFDFGEAKYDDDEDADDDQGDGGGDGGGGQQLPWTSYLQNHEKTCCSHAVDKAKTKPGLRLVYNMTTPSLHVVCKLDAHGSC